jgi:Chitinase
MHNTNTQSNCFQKRLGFILLIVFCSLSASTIINAANNLPSYKIISYLPLWKEWRAGDIDAGKLTHINLAFAEISDGMISDKIKPTQLQAIRKLKKTNRQLKVLISIGGWGNDCFSNVALTEESRNKFAASVAAYIHRYKLDGADIDWEFPVIGGGDNKGLPGDK